MVLETRFNYILKFWALFLSKLPKNDLPLKQAENQKKESVKDNFNRKIL